MKKLNACLIVFCLIVLTSISILGCKNSSEGTKESDTFSIEVVNGDEKDLVSTIQKWHITEKKICVLFGYDFNDSKTVENLTEILAQNFGLAQDGGLIFPVVYPNDFKHGTKGYVNDFLSVLQDDENDFCGVVLLGAPDNTHVALARNQDKWNEKVPYPVIALFPQDEILGIEATCDIVLDKGQSVEMEGGMTNEETASVFITEAPDVLVRTINYMMVLEGALKADTTVQTHIAQMLKGYDIHHYTDPETGLQSINHFVMN